MKALRFAMLQLLVLLGLHALPVASADPCSALSSATSGSPLAAAPLNGLQAVVSAAGASARRSGPDLQGELQFQLGTYSGLQASLVFLSHKNVSVALEAFGGLSVLAPAFGGGGRVELKPLNGEHNALVLAPGVDVYDVPTNGKWFFSPLSPEVNVSPNADVKWLHQLSNGAAFELGVRAGANLKFVSGESESTGLVLQAVTGVRF